MTSLSLVLGLACLVISVVGFPSGQDPLSRLRRSPQNGVMVRGYFMRTPTYDTYYPRAAYGAGMAGVGSYYTPRRNCRNCNQLEEDLPMAVPEPAAESSDPRDDAPEDVPVEDVTAVSLPEVDREEDRKPEVEVPKEEEVPTSTIAPKPKTPKKSRTPKSRPIDVDDDDEEEEAPRKAGRKGGDSPSFSNFFPMSFGGGSRRRSGEGEEDGQNPGLVAIANSFSTGRGAIATSHATAFGGPAPAPAARGSPSRYRS